MRNREAKNTNFIVFGLTWSGLEPTIYRIWGEHITDAVRYNGVLKTLWKLITDNL